MELFYAILALIAAIPAGYILKQMTQEEIKPGKPYFKIIWIVALFGALLAYIIVESQVLKNTLTFGLLFVAIATFISWYDGNTKQRRNGRKV